MGVGVGSIKGGWAYGNVGGHGGDVDVVEHDVVGPDEEIGPAGGVLEVQALDLDVGGVVCQEEDGAVVRVVWVEDLGTREAVPPRLAISVEGARSVDLDVPGMYK